MINSGHVANHLNIASNLKIGKPIIDELRCYLSRMVRSYTIDGILKEILFVNIKYCCAPCVTTFAYEYVTLFKAKSLSFLGPYPHPEIRTQIQSVLCDVNCTKVGL